VFNVAVPFIDRHVAEGRADRVALRTGAEDVTYGQLAERVNRCGHLLQSMGLAPGDRVLMIVKDCPEFVYLFWGAIKIGVVPVPVNTLLRAADYRYMIDDSGCGLLVYSPEYAAEVEPALAGARHKPAAMQIEGSREALQARLRRASPLLDAMV
jgi:acyl-coenzyme A synthetase/AMP-(fatty) acid ligase